MLVPQAAFHTNLASFHRAQWSVLVRLCSQALLTQHGCHGGDRKEVGCTIVGMEDRVQEDHWSGVVMSELKMKGF